MAARGSLTIIFPEQVQSVDTSSISSTSSVTAGGQVVTTTTEDGQTYSLTCVLADGYKLDNANLSDAVNGGSVVSVTDDSINIMAGSGGIAGTLVITVRQSISTVSGKWKWNDNPVVNNAIDTVHIIFTCNNTSYTSISISNTTSGPGNICYGPTNNVVYGLDLGDTWSNQAYRTLDFGSSPQEVSDEFYDYLRANATQINSVSGVWVWNDGDNIYERDGTVSVNFTSNGQSYSSMVFSYGYDGPDFDPARVDFSIKYDTTEVLFATYSYQGSWSNQAYRTVDFGSIEQEVSQEFYNYLIQNANQGGEEPVNDVVKTVSSDNLARFKQKCDETYAAIGNIPTVSTELVNLGTLSTSGTLTTDQITQIGTTTIGVTARASVNGVTRFYERVNISGTTAMLVSADDDALHVLTVNLSTRAYTLSDVALGGGGIEDNAVIENSPQELPSATADSADFVQYPAGTLNFKAKNFQGNASGYTRLATYDEIPDVPEIPTPTASDNGKVLGIESGVYTIVDKPEQYVLPVATESVLGGVKPSTKTSTMTQSVGVDSNGALWTEPAGDSITYATDGEINALFTSSQVQVPTITQETNSAGGTTYNIDLGGQ